MSQLGDTHTRSDEHAERPTGEAKDLWGHATVWMGLRRNGVTEGSPRAQGDVGVC